MFLRLSFMGGMWSGAGAWLLSARGQSVSVVTLLAMQSMLLWYSATLHSPTHLEPAFLASGVSHWQLGRFDLYRVNPPLVRMVAALPVVVVGCETDWSQFRDGPGLRTEYSVGEDFIKANGSRSIPLFFYARWACIPFSLIGAFFAYKWAKELYGPAAGLITLILYVFEPNLLAHGELITPDGPCTAFGILAGYTFWRWLRCPNWLRALLAGVALGLAELTKMSWLILFGLWPLIWVLWALVGGGKNAVRKRGREDVQKGFRKTPGVEQTDSEVRSSEPQFTLGSTAPQLAAILLFAVYLINVGYSFDESGTALKDFEFVSTMLTGNHTAGASGNRFKATWIGDLRIPFPKQYVLGFDQQKRDFEYFPLPSYLRGTWAEDGWWYYYLYGLLVKVPSGTWILFGLVILNRVCDRGHAVHWRDELVIILPALALLVLVSSQTEFNIHLRYVFPSLGLFLVFLGSSASFFSNRCTASGMVILVLVAYSASSICFVYPHQLAYFNDFVGGPANGDQHLLGSSLDWGQDAMLAAQWIETYMPQSHVEKFGCDPWIMVAALQRTRESTRFTSLLAQQSMADLAIFDASGFNRRGGVRKGEVVLKRFPSGMVVVQAARRGIQN